MNDTVKCYKIPHKHKGQALAALRDMRRRHYEQASGMHVYRCPRCGRYHVGHDRGADRPGLAPWRDAERRDSA